MNFKLGQILYRVYRDAMIEYKIFNIAVHCNRIGILRVGDTGNFYLSTDYLKQHFFTTEKGAWQEHRKNLTIQIESDRKRLEECYAKLDSNINRLAIIDSIISGLTHDI